MQRRGLRALPQRNRPTGPIQRSHVAKMLSDRYYLGYVPFMGAEYEGRHQPLVHQILFDRVQEVLALRRRGGEKRRKNPTHYLIGSISCAHCGGRLSFICPRGNGGLYEYFFCIGHAQHRTDCKFPYVPVDKVEAAVERYYDRVRLPKKAHTTITKGLRVLIAYQEKHAKPALKMAERRLKKLEEERKRLARGVVDGSVPGDLARGEYERIAREAVTAEETLVPLKRSTHTSNPT